MVIKTFEVPQIAFHIILSFLSLDFLVCEARVVFLLVFIQVALIVAARRAAVSRPSTHTDPAELVPTH